MQIKVAGAGAGKTTNLANIISSLSFSEGKNTYCIAFSNSATENISKRVNSTLKYIPKNLKISTIHSFLFSEIIDPYYYWLYYKQFKKISTISLPQEYIYRNQRISSLEQNNILHITKIPERAKWVIYKKSTDNKTICNKRKQILSSITNYCDRILVDEAQDIDEDMKKILEVFDELGIDIILFGDPKQDIHGRNCFRQLIEQSNEVEYISESYRCPPKHIVLSNLLTPDIEQQKSCSKNEGTVHVVYESQIDNVNSFLSKSDFGLKYISRSNNRFATHMTFSNTRLNDLCFEIYSEIKSKWNKELSELRLKRISYYYSEYLIDVYAKNQDCSLAINYLVKKRIINRLDKQKYAQICKIIESKNQNNDLLVVQSIESVKGLESDNCLFVLTTDLAPYLFQIKHDYNKTKNLLYVALTRSLNHLTILITNEVEEKYSKDFIEKFFAKYINS